MRAPQLTGLAKKVSGSNLVRRNVGAALALLSLLVAAPRVARAHIKMSAPTDWLVTDASGDPQKITPCGVDPTAAASTYTASNAVTTVHTGDKLVVNWTETVPHDGHFRIALAINSRSELMDPAVTASNKDGTPKTVATSTAYPVLADGLFEHTAASVTAGKAYTYTVTIPNTPCTKCTLQLLQFMAKHPARSVVLLSSLRRPHDPRCCWRDWRQRRRVRHRRRGRPLDGRRGRPLDGRQRRHRHRRHRHERHRRHRHERHRRHRHERHRRRRHERHRRRRHERHRRRRLERHRRQQRERHRRQRHGRQQRERHRRQRDDRDRRCHGYGRQRWRRDERWLQLRDRRRGLRSHRPGTRMRGVGWCAPSPARPLMTGDWSETVLRMSVAVLAAGLIGWDRQRGGQPAGLRTHMLVGLGAALMVSIPLSSGGMADASRAVQGVATGIGFLCAGDILHQHGQGGTERVKGLTSAAALWVTAALGMVAAIGAWRHVVIGTIGTLLILIVMRPVERFLVKDHPAPDLPPEAGLPRTDSPTA